MSVARLLVTAVVLSGSVLACTVIVNGKLGDKADYPLAEGGAGSSGGTSGSSGTSGGTVDDPCSLLVPPGSSSSGRREPRPDNTCAQCINNACAAEVAYACDADASSPKPWFGKLARCAQNPWDGFPAPDSGADFSWGCSEYKELRPQISDDGSDVEQERAAQNCVHIACASSDKPPCKLCEVAIDKSSTNPSAGKALLRNDDCGKCFLQCEDVLVECCNTAPMDDFVAHCSFTADEEQKKLCLRLGKEVVGDGGPYRGPSGSNSYDQEDRYCTKKLQDCFNVNCFTKEECKPPPF